MESILSEYRDGKSIEEIAQKGFSPCLVRSVLIEDSIVIRMQDKTSVKYHDTDVYYFNNIDTHTKAQILGFIWAEGSIIGNSIQITQAEPCFYYLYCIKCELKYRGKLTIVEDQKWTVNSQAMLTITRKQIANTLVEDYGFTGKKEDNLSFPKNLPEEFLNSFLLGLFDGDGSITVSLTKNHGNPYISGGFNITSTKQICDTIKNIFKSRFPSLRFSVSKEGSRTNPKNAYKLNCTSGPSGIIAIMRWLTSGNTHFLNKKKYDRYIMYHNLAMRRKALVYLSKNSKHPANLIPKVATDAFGERKYVRTVADTFTKKHNLSIKSTRKFFYGTRFPGSKGKSRLYLLAEYLGVTVEKLINFPLLVEEGVIEPFMHYSDCKKKITIEIQQRKNSKFLSFDVDHMGVVTNIK